MSRLVKQSTKTSFTITRGFHLPGLFYRAALPRLRGPGRDADPGRPLTGHASLVAGRRRARECVSGPPSLAAGPGSRRSGVRAGHGRWLAA